MGIRRSTHGCWRCSSLIIFYLEYGTRYQRSRAVPYWRSRPLYVHRLSRYRALLSTCACTWGGVSACRATVRQADREAAAAATHARATSLAAGPFCACPARTAGGERNGEAALRTDCFSNTPPPPPPPPFFQRKTRRPLPPLPPPPPPPRSATKILVLVTIPSIACAFFFSFSFFLVSSHHHYHHAAPRRAEQPYPCLFP